MPETKLTAEEVQAMREARRSSTELMKRLQAGGQMFVPVDELVLDKEKNERVIMTVPRSFNLTLQDHRKVLVPAGIASVPMELADHWYVKANGCKPYARGSITQAQQAAPQTLLGSDELPNVVNIGGTKQPIAGFIEKAVARAKLSIVDWNALPEEERRDRIVDELDAASRSAREAADKAKAQMKQEPIEAAKAQIDEASKPDAPPSPVAAGETKPEADRADAAVNVEGTHVNAAPEADKAS